MSNEALLKLLFFWQKPKAVVVTNSQNLELTKKLTWQVLGKLFLLEKKVLIVDGQEQSSLKGKKYLILNYDEENIRRLKNQASSKVLTFGFRSGADFRASDVKVNDGTNFKINHHGNIVPVWLGKSFGKEYIYAALAAAAVGEVFGLNLVEVSGALKKNF